MKRLIAITVVAVSALLFAGGTAAATPFVVSPLDTIVDYGQLVRISGTPEVCGLSQAPTRVEINKKWTKQEMSPVIFCWASNTGRPIIGVQVALIYWIRGKSVVGLTAWQRGGKFHPYPVFLYPRKIWPVMSEDWGGWGTTYSLDLQEVPLSADQLTGKVRKKISTMGGRSIVPREEHGFGCTVQVAPVEVICKRTGTWDEWSSVFLINAPWRAQDVTVAYWNPSCGCQWQVAYDPSHQSTAGEG